MAEEARARGRPILSADTTRPKVSEKIGYGLGDFASNLFWQMFSIFIAKFYTDVFLMSAATLGTMLLVTRMGERVQPEEQRACRRRAGVGRRP